MSPLLHMIRLEVAKYWSSSSKVLSFFIVLLTGFFMGPANVVSGSSLASNSWDIAGQTFHYAGAMAGLIGACWASASILEDRDLHRFELKIVSGCNSTGYVLSKLGALFIPLAIAGILLASLSFVYCGIAFGTTSIAAFISALVVVYFPVVIFAVIFGGLLSIVTKSRFAPIAAYVALWIIGFLWLPEPSSAFDVTGEALSIAFFSISPEALSATGSAQGSSTVFNVALAQYSEQRFYGRYDLLFLILTSALMLAALIVLFHYAWKINARSLLPSDGNVLLHYTSSSRLATYLKTCKAVRIGIVAIVLLPTSLLQALSDSPFSIGAFFIECFTPICFAFVFSGMYACDVKAGLSELLLSRPRIRKHYGFRIATTSAVLGLILVIQAFQWHEAMSANPMSLIFAGFVSSLFFSALAFTLSVLLRSETAANTLVACAWLFLQIPSVREAASQSALHLVYPFQLSISGAAGMGDIAVLPLLVLSTGMLLIGIWLIGRPGLIGNNASKN